MSCQVNLITGPAGSGKTFNCISEIRSQLEISQFGKPIIFILPRQATFQAEQAVFNQKETKIGGSMRLHIVSFKRLSNLLLDILETAPENILNKEARIMVFQALLQENPDNLLLYKNHREDILLANDLEKILTKLRVFSKKTQYSPLESLESFLKTHTSPTDVNSRLFQKIHDIHFIYKKYFDWIRENEIRDDESAYEQVCGILEQWANEHPNEYLLEQIWLDGFTDISPQEIKMIEALTHVTKQMSLHFCLELPDSITTIEKALHYEGPSNFWKYTIPFFNKCCNLFKSLELNNICKVQIKRISNLNYPNRFTNTLPLAALERNWLRDKSNSISALNNDSSSESVALYSCTSARDEAILAAREIIRFIRAGNRYNDCCVLFRSMETYEQIFRRIFLRYKIPFFLDTPHNICHHPAVDFTIQTLHVFLKNWELPELMALLRTELANISLKEADNIENKLCRINYTGYSFWERRIWETWELGKNYTIKDLYFFQNIYQKAIETLLKLQKKLQITEENKQSLPIPNSKLVEVIRFLWEYFGLEEKLEEWSTSNLGNNNQLASLQIESGLSPQLHQTVWTNINEWLKNFHLAFNSKSYTLQKWIHIIEAGFKEMTVSAIPASLDQTLIGTFDRTRTPKVKLVILAGFNEGVFPYLSNPSVLFSENEAQLLASHLIEITENVNDAKNRENYLSYIAVTRSSQRLVITYSLLENSNEEVASRLYPSTYISELKKYLPPHTNSTSAFSSNQLSTPEFCLSKCEISGLNITRQLSHTPKELRQWLYNCHYPEISINTLLSTYHELITSPVDLFKNKKINLSVSKLESYSSCPFAFFAKYILKTHEPDKWGFSPNKLGNLIHNVLDKFHHKVCELNKTWPEALENQILTEQLEQDSLKEALEDTFGKIDSENFLIAGGETYKATTHLKVSAYLAMMKIFFSNYKFIPIATEFSFGFDGEPLWNIDLRPEFDFTISLKGRIDRLDGYLEKNDNTLWLNAIDYKSSKKDFNEESFKAGIQLQLICYLCVIRQKGFLDNLLKKFPQKTISSAKQVAPSGTFYVPLTIPTQTDKGISNSPHTGRFNKDLLRLYCKSSSTASSFKQFSVRITKNGSIHASDKTPISPEKLTTLCDTAEKTILLLARSILRGVFPVQPLQYASSSSCDYCPVQCICRFDSRLNKPLPPISTDQRFK